MRFACFTAALLSVILQSQHAAAIGLPANQLSQTASKGSDNWEDVLQRGLKVLGGTQHSQTSSSLGDLPLPSSFSQSYEDIAGGSATTTAAKPTAATGAPATQEK